MARTLLSSFLALISLVACDASRVQIFALIGKDDGPAPDRSQIREDSSVKSVQQLPKPGRFVSRHNRHLAEYGRRRKSCRIYGSLRECG